jgi:hypothetical protein
MNELQGEENSKVVWNDRGLFKKDDWLLSCCSIHTNETILLHFLQPVAKRKQPTFNS